MNIFNRFKKIIEIPPMTIYELRQALTNEALSDEQKDKIVQIFQDYSIEKSYSTEKSQKLFIKDSIITNKFHKFILSSGSMIMED